MFVGDAQSFASAVEMPSAVAVPAPAAPPIPHMPAGRYGEGGKRLSAPVVLAIAGIHAGLLAALIFLDVVPLKAEEPRMVATFIAEAVPPPPAPAAELPPPPEPAKVEMVAPPPIVSTPSPAPVRVATVDVPPPPQPAALAASAPPSPAPPVAAPVVPPSLSGNQKDTPLPRYPVESNRRRETGTVTLLVLVTPQGLPETVKVKTSSGFERLDKAALDAVRRWKFTPATQAGEPVSAWMIVPIPFQLKPRGA